MRGNNHLHHFFLLSSQRFPTSEYYVMYFCNNNIMYDRTLVCILMYNIDDRECCVKHTLSTPFGSEYLISFRAIHLASCSVVLEIIFEVIAMI